MLDNGYNSEVKKFRKNEVITLTYIGLQKVNVMVTKVVC